MPVIQSVLPGLNVDRNGMGPLSTLTAPLRLLDLFAGAGGLSYGFGLARRTCGCPMFSLVAAVEKDHAACESLRANHATDEGEACPIIESDLTLAPTHEAVLDRIGNAQVDVIVGGPPCQSYSQIGTRTGRWVNDARFLDDGRDLLFEEYVALVSELMPRFVVLENVDGIRSKLNADGEPFLSVIIRSLEELGYSFRLAGLPRQKYLRLNAASYGVPQVRNRIFLVGNRLGIDLLPPNPTHYDPASSASKRPPSARWPWLTVFDATGDLPQVFAHYTKSHLTPGQWRYYNSQNRKRDEGADEVPYHSVRFQLHYQRLGPAGRTFLDFIKATPGDPLRYHRARNQQLSDVQLFAAMAPGSTAEDLLKDSKQKKLMNLIRYDMSSFTDKYRKQSWTKPSTTIFAHLERDGNRFIHPDDSQARTFTVREAARLQSFPDSYILSGGLKSRYRQIGNAVPPLLAKALAEAIYETLDVAGLVRACRAHNEIAGQPSGTHRNGR